MDQITKALFFPASLAQRVVFEKSWPEVGATLLEGNEFLSNVYSVCIRRCRRRIKESKLTKARESEEAAMGKATSKTKRKD